MHTNIDVIIPKKKLTDYIEKRKKTNSMPIRNRFMGGHPDEH